MIIITLPYPVDYRVFNFINYKRLNIWTLASSLCTFIAFTSTVVMIILVIIVGIVVVIHDGGFSLTAYDYYDDYHYEEQEPR